MNPICSIHPRLDQQRHKRHIASPAHRDDHIFPAKDLDDSSFCVKSNREDDCRKGEEDANQRDESCLALHRVDIIGCHARRRWEDSWRCDFCGGRHCDCCMKPDRCRKSVAMQETLKLGRYLTGVRQSKGFSAREKRVTTSIGPSLHRERERRSKPWGIREFDIVLLVPSFERWSTFRQACVGIAWSAT